MNSDLSEALKALKDIHTPTGVAIWPLPIGWWLALLLLVVLMGLLRYWYKHRQPRYKKTALRELKHGYHIYQTHQDTAQFIQTVSQLIRRVALVAFIPEQVAGLTGKAWLSFLDKTGNTDAFTHGAGKVLSVAPYQPTPMADIDALMDATRRWLGAIK